MVVKGIVRKGVYFDSVSLMMIARQVNELDGISDSALVMGTKENRSILQSSHLLIPEFKNTGDTDLLIAIKAFDRSKAEAALQAIDRLLKEKKTQKEEQGNYIPKSLDKALEIMPDANLSLISIAGKYAYHEAVKALEKDLHVMIFSDNVPLDKEIQLKKSGRDKGLLVMGPDCGTAIINGAPLGFANVVARGNIGIVAASGTGLQEVSSVITGQGAGISQAIGTGGRDVSKEVGGIMFIEGMKALNRDKDTKVITLISKPPHKDVLNSIMKEMKNITKPTVAIFLGSPAGVLKGKNVIFTHTLEEAALRSVALSKGKDPDGSADLLRKREEEIRKIAEKEAKKKRKTQKYIRGLYSGGTLCDEAQIIFRDMDEVGLVYSNTPLDPKYRLKDSWKSREHSVIDLGGDEFTVGRPHPMIDFSLRNKKILEEAMDPGTAVILLDVVLGYGSNMHPDRELAPVIREALQTAGKKKRHLTVICSVTGTDKDPQDKNAVEENLKGS
ncbi:MAG: acyl-CoA synthetase FdrA, partial [Spirochaetes bacterium]|nr:acyl-CoA synthetase FdrA [Spirochaetota bacterium]